MISKIITIGDEILIGQIVDTNSAWIANKLNKIGVSVREMISISDTKDAIIDELKSSFKNTDLVIITGGLGPTNDDITKHTLHEFFGGELIEDKGVLLHIINLFESRGLQVTEMNKGQAMVPDSCTVLPNIDGTAPGMWFEKEGVVFISIPGVPFEMKTIVENEIIHRIVAKYDLPVLYHRTVLTQGIAESFLADKIKKWENNLPKHIRLAYLPSPGMVRLRLSGFGKNKTNLERQVNDEISSLTQIIDKYVFGYDNDTLESVIGKILAKYECSMATAESCTGGAVASKITSVSGSSQYFKGAVVAYDNMVKVNTLNVSGEDILNFGAVSKEVVEQMAKGVRDLFGTDYAVSTSGIAGPTGGTKEKPVGTVWVAVASSKIVISKKFMFGEHRERNITRSVFSALNMLRRLLLEEKGR